MPITITEALAEIKTVNKRLESKRAFVQNYLTRQDGLRDPLERDGGSPEAIKRERQAIGDLTQRVVSLRRGIQRSNDATSLTINGTARSISDWLTWRRDVAPGDRSFLVNLRTKLNQTREQARRSGYGVVTAGTAAEKPTDIIVNLNEFDLAAEIEKFEDTLGQLDGLLSLKNATVQIAEA